MPCLYVARHLPVKREETRVREILSEMLGHLRTSLSPPVQKWALEAKPSASILLIELLPPLALLSQRLLLQLSPLRGDLRVLREVLRHHGGAQALLLH